IDSCCPVKYFAQIAAHPCSASHQVQASKAIGTIDAKDAAIYAELI
ncbi:MAG: hypothetical protein K0Q99_2277, partial [Clostridia bacterium]|nr:hypothetical protein [Clostridia bacterium]